MKRSLSTFILYACALAPLGAQVSPPQKAKYILLDGRSATDDDLAKIYTAVAQAYQLRNWTEISTTGSTSLPQILAAKYNLGQSETSLYPKTTDALLQSIAKVNKMTGGPLPRSLLIPRLPAIPNRTASPYLAQVQTIAADYAVRPLASLYAEKSLNRRAKPLPASEAAVMAFLDTTDVRTALATQKQFAFTTRLYPRVGDSGSFKMFPLNLTGDECATRIANGDPIRTVLPDSLKARLAKIDPVRAGYLYILDFDVEGGQCSHGRKVADVARQLLRDYGAPQLANNVRTIELDYFAHPAEVRQNIATILDTVIFSELRCDYLRLFVESFGRQLDSCATDPKDFAIPAAVESKDISVPGFYLWLIFEYLLDPVANASVISNSYYTSTGGFEIASSIQPRRWPALVAAVLNPDPDNPVATYVDEIKVEQPAKRFFQIDEKHGTFLVGALLRDGEPFGMTSAPPLANVEDDYGALTSFALGEGYGQVDSAHHVTSAISPDDRGTSFATPAISTEIFLARALWNSEMAHAENEPSSPEEIGVIEAKRRLKLSAEVLPTLIGKAASAGIPRFERLAAVVTVPADVLIRKDDTVEVGEVKQAFVKVKGVGRSYPQDFGGIQERNGKLLIFDEKLRAWRAADPDSLYIEFTGPVGSNTTSEFFALYKSVARYTR